MKIGTIIAFRNETIGEPEGGTYRLLAKAGFDCIDFSLAHPVNAPIWQLSDEELKAEMLRQREMIESCGLTVSQSHSPYDYNLGCAWMDPEKRKGFWHAQVQAIKAASFIGSPYTVIHALTIPGRMAKEGFYEETKRCNMEFFAFLKPWLEEYDVRLAIENAFIADHTLGRMDRCGCSGADDLIDYIDSTGSDRFVACLDTGHAQVAGQDPVEMIYKLGKKYLRVLHIQDTDLIRDQHMFPGSGKGDWYRIGQALRDIGFEGAFSFELSNPYWLRFPELEKDMLPVLHRFYVELGKAITGTD